MASSFFRQAVRGLRRALPRAGVLLLVLGGVPVTSRAEPEAPAEVRYAVVDLHVDVPWQVHFKGRDPRLTEGHANASTLLTGAYGGMVFPIYLPDYLHKNKGPLVSDAEAILSTIETIMGTAGVFVPPGQAAQPGKVTGFVSIEGAGAFAGDITQIDRFIERGVRLIGPVHARNNGLASSATGQPVDFGFTGVGRDFCERVYKNGALIDVSHLSDKAFADLVPIAKKYGAPIVATHSNARAVARHPRNLTDGELRIIGETGGVAGLNFHTPFVTGKTEATVDDVIRQLEHMVKVAGIDHVAIGSDFDGGIKPAAGLEDASMMPALAARLRKKGMSEEDVLKIFSLNALRILGWRSPDQMKRLLDAATPAAPAASAAPAAPAAEK